MTTLDVGIVGAGPLRDTGGERGKALPERAKSGQTEDGSDQELVRRCAQRDAAALREIVRRYDGKLSRFLSQILGSPEDTEEALQDVFLRVWQQASRYEGRASFATWLFRIAANVAYDLLRHRKTECRTTPLLDCLRIAGGDAEAEALDGLEREGRTRRLQQALLRLRAPDRLLLVLYYGQEMEYSEMMGVTGLSYPVLKVRLARARCRLRDALEAEE